MLRYGICMILLENICLLFFIEVSLDILPWASPAA